MVGFPFVDYRISQSDMVLDDIDDDKLAAEAIRQLHDYLDHMPRWVLKGYAPCEV